MTVFEGFDRDFHEVADLDFDLAAVAAEFLDRDVTLGFQAGIDDDEIVIGPDHFCGDDLAHPHFLAGETFLEQRGEVFNGGCRGLCFHHSVQGVGVARRGDGVG